MSPSKLAVEFEEVLRSYYAASGLNIAMRCWTSALSDPHGQSLIPNAFLLHTTSFCLNVKRTQNEACRKCDLRDAPKLCRPERHVFTRTCHAGADEILIPLYRQDALVGLVYLGQFRRNARGPSALPWISPERLKEMEALAMTLRGYVYQLMDRNAAAQREAADDTQRRIVTFIETNLSGGASVSDLAKALKLSTSRARHVVTERMGKPYRTLLEEQRLRRARELLTSTSGKIAWIARQVGFQDENYFCRYFKQKVGQPPGQYRAGLKTTHDA